MSEHLHHEESNITLPSAVLTHLNQITAGALRVYVFLSSRRGPEPLPTAIPVIAKATGLGDRSVISALKVLRTNGLVVRHRGKGRHANSYSLPFVPPTADRPAGGEKVSSPRESPRTVPELISLVYRAATDEEVAELTKKETDEAILLKKLECLRRTGSVPRLFSFDRFVDVVRNLVY